MTPLPLLVAGIASVSLATGGLTAYRPAVQTAGAASAVAAPGRAFPAQPRDGPRWEWPVSPAGAVLRPFVAPPSRWGAGHRGLDLGAPPGREVRAVERGTVSHAGRVAGRGTVTVRHLDGLESTYEPVTAAVEVGAAVLAGQRIGALEAGSGHCGEVGCLHLGAVRDAAYIDPWPLLMGEQVSLLPVSTLEGQG